MRSEINNDTVASKKKPISVYVYTVTSEHISFRKDSHRIKNNIPIIISNLKIKQLFFEILANSNTIR